MHLIFVFVCLYTQASMQYLMSELMRADTPTHMQYRMQNGEQFCEMGTTINKYHTKGSYKIWIKAYTFFILK
jgi:hypothetical protein